MYSLSFASSIYLEQTLDLLQMRKAGRKNAGTEVEGTPSIGMLDTFKSLGSVWHGIVIIDIGKFYLYHLMVMGHDFCYHPNVDNSFT